MDRQWWQTYLNEVNATFLGERFSNNKLPINYRVTHLPKLSAHANSGIGAIATALQGGAERVILLGYDVQKTNGKAHWHGNHPKGLGNAGRIEKWPEKFAFAAREFKAEILNASRATALNCWPRVKLEDIC